MIKTFKKIYIYILVGLLSFFSCSYAYYKPIYAMEWVGGALAFEEAVKWLLGAIGIVSATGVSHDYWQNHSEEFLNYCADQNITDTQVTEWQMKLCEGILDKGSECWDAFKTWASSLIPAEDLPTGLIQGDFIINTPTYNTSALRSFLENNGFSGVSINADVGNAEVDIIFYYNNTPLSGGGNGFTGINSNGHNLIYDDGRIYSEDGGDFYVYPCGYIYGEYHQWGQYGYGSYPVVTNDTSKISYSNPFNWLYGQLAGDVTVSNVGNRHIYDVGISSDSVSDSNITTINRTINTTNIINKYITNEGDTEVSLPYPGLSDSDNAASSDTYDNIIDAINDGTITIDDGISRIQDLLKVISYDTVTDDVIPNVPDEDTGENKKKDDVIQETRENGAFTLYGLEKVFPFCIPWDIYAFVNVLRADPVPPVLNFPFPNVRDLSHPIYITLDFSSLDEAMGIIRLAEDFLFILGLAFATRSLIGSGGSD